LQKSVYFDEALYHRISKKMLIVQRQANGMHLESISLFLSFEVGQTTSRRSGAGTAITIHSSQPHLTSTATVLRLHANTASSLDTSKIPQLHNLLLSGFCLSHCRHGSREGKMELTYARYDAAFKQDKHKYIPPQC
jgi:hypothetical protein